jgi:hypothetical protein
LPDDLQDWQPWEGEDPFLSVCWDDPTYDPALHPLAWSSQSEFDVYLDPASNDTDSEVDLYLGSETPVPAPETFSPIQTGIEVSPGPNIENLGFQPIPDGYDSLAVSPNSNGYDSPLASPIINSICQEVEAMEL